MALFLQSLFVMLAGCDRDALARQVQYLKVENQILRSKLPKRIDLTCEERARLLKFGKLVGPVIKELISIVHPKTFARWVREAANHIPRPLFGTVANPISEFRAIFQNSRAVK
jgi:putative transposase